jgi:hypothetical protein
MTPPGLWLAAAAAATEVVDEGGTDGRTLLYT